MKMEMILGSEGTEKYIMNPILHTKPRLGVSHHTLVTFNGRLRLRMGPALALPLFKLFAEGREIGKGKMRELEMISLSNHLGSWSTRCVCPSPLMYEAWTFRKPQF